MCVYCILESHSRHSRGARASRLTRARTREPPDAGGLTLRARGEAPGAHVRLRPAGRLRRDFAADPGLAGGIRSAPAAGARSLTPRARGDREAGVAATP